MKIPLFADEMILHIENPKEYTKKKTIRIKRFSKIIEHKINV